MFENKQRDEITTKSSRVFAQLSKRLAELGSNPRIPVALAILGGIIFLIQIWTYIHTLDSNLDEGAYLYKGYLFITGQYTPYQDYGPWSNKMPLSFLIPGLVQYVFGTGIGTARYFTVILAALIVLGVWILACRLGGRWWGAASVWVFALNPAIIKMYSLSVSQVLVAFLLVWTLVFTLGKGRTTWQIVLGAFIAGIMVMTRINMLFVIPLLILYIFWEHGLRSGLMAAAIATATIVIIHAIYWPGILIIWAHAIPKSLSPFLNDWRPSGVVDTWSPAVSTRERLMALFLGIRFHFVAIMGVLSAWILWPRRIKWKSQANFRASVLLSGIFLILLVLHLYASIGQGFCVFCFSGYLSFFSMVGVLLVVASFSSWKTNVPWWLLLVIVLIIVIISTGIGFSAFEDIEKELLNLPVPRFILDFPSMSPGSVPLQAVLINKFNLEFSFLRRLIPTIAGFLTGTLILIFTLGVIWVSDRNKGSKIKTASFQLPPFGYLALLIFLLAGILLSPTKALGGGRNEYDCSGDVILSYQAAGNHLAELIPPGSLVYWKGTLSAAPLLYVPGIRIYPSQINASYSLKQEGNEDILLKFGFWSPELAEEWIFEADYVLIQQLYFKGWEKDILKSDRFEELEPTPQVVECREGSRIRIFKRVH